MRTNNEGLNQIYKLDEKGVTYKIYSFVLLLIIY
jgi:hypothetical protein